MIGIEPSKNLSKISPYLFAKINQTKREAYDKNLDVIDLSMRSPDLPTSSYIVDRLCDRDYYAPSVFEFQ